MRLAPVPDGFRIDRRFAPLARRPEWKAVCLTCGEWTVRFTHAGAAFWARTHACVEHLQWSDDDPPPPF